MLISSSIQTHQIYLFICANREKKINITKGGWDINLFFFNTKAKPIIFQSRYCNTEIFWFLLNLSQYRDKPQNKKMFEGNKVINRHSSPRNEEVYFKNLMFHKQQPGFNIPEILRTMNTCPDADVDSEFGSGMFLMIIFLFY